MDCEPQAGTELEANLLGLLSSDFEGFFWDGAFVRRIFSPCLKAVVRSVSMLANKLFYYYQQ